MLYYIRAVAASAAKAGKRCPEASEVNMHYANTDK